MRADVPRQRFWPRAATLCPLVKRHRAYWCERTWVTEQQGGGGVLFVGEEARRGEKRSVKAQRRAACIAMVISMSIESSSPQ
jgi:hypothetical protein